MRTASFADSRLDRTDAAQLAIARRYPCRGPHVAGWHRPPGTGILSASTGVDALLTTAFDTYAAAKRLRDAGFDERQAEAAVSMVRDAAGADLANLATKADVAALKGDIDALRTATKADIAALKGDIDALRTETKADIAALKGDIDALRTETKADIAALKGDIDALRTETKADIAALKGDIDALRTETKADTEALRTTTKADIAALKADIAGIDARIDALRAELGTVRWAVGLIAAFLFIIGLRVFGLI